MHTDFRMDEIKDNKVPLKDLRESDRYKRFHPLRPLNMLKGQMIKKYSCKLFIHPPRILEVHFTGLPQDGKRQAHSDY